MVYKSSCGEDPALAGFSISQYYMAKFILGRKLGMSQIFDQTGKIIPVTLVEAGPCEVTQVKTGEKDKYEAVQLGFLPKTKHVKKTEKGKVFKYLREFPAQGGPASGWKAGDIIDVSAFQEGDKVKVSGISKGKGFQGAVKRWGFKGKLSVTHGTKHEERILGSVGSSFPGRVYPGKKMSGRMGSAAVTVKNLKIVKIDKENNILAIKGAVPGPNSAILEILC